MPDTGFHSVILKPDSVRRVTPPTTMTANTRPDEARSHIPTGGGERIGSSAVAPWDAFDEKKRGSKGCFRLDKLERSRFCAESPPPRNPCAPVNLAVLNVARKDDVWFRVIRGLTLVPRMVRMEVDTGPLRA